MANLLDETIAILTRHGKAPGDVVWVGNAKYSGSWLDFAALANFEYDAGYGAECIPLDLRVVGHSWWLERHEYDGSEWWEFKALPVRTASKPLRQVDVGDGVTWGFGRNGAKMDDAGEEIEDDEPPTVTTGNAPTLGGL